MSNDRENEGEQTIDFKHIKREARKKAVILLDRFIDSPKSMHAVLREYLADENPSSELYTMVQALTMSVVRYLNTLDFLISRSRLPFMFKDMPSIERCAIRLATFEGRWLKTPFDDLEKDYLEGMEHLWRPLRRAVGLSLERITSQLNEIERLGVKYSHPSFLVKTLVDNLGRDEAVALMKADLEQRPYYVRPNRLKFDPDKMREALHKSGIEIEPDPDVEGVFKVVHGADKIVRSSLFRDGNVLMQDKASVLTVKTLNPRSGEVVWDACAAPGMKTQLIWEMMDAEGRLVASEIHPGRLRSAVERVKIIGHSGVSWLQADASTVPVTDADKILIDAPCSSTGILRSRPSFKWKLNKRNLMNIMSIQHKILENIVVQYMDRSGTEIVYATCSILPHEGESQIDSLLSRHEVELIEDSIPGARQGYPGFNCTSKVRRLFPHSNDTSGFFIAHIRIP